jgi:hypothetical protein
LINNKTAKLVIFFYTSRMPAKFTDEEIEALTATTLLDLTDDIIDAQTIAILTRIATRFSNGPITARLKPELTSLVRSIVTATTRAQHAMKMDELQRVADAKFAALTQAASRLQQKNDEQRAHHEQQQAAAQERAGTMRNVAKAEKIELRQENEQETAIMQARVNEAEENRRVAERNQRHALQERDDARRITEQQRITALQLQDASDREYQAKMEERDGELERVVAAAVDLRHDIQHQRDETDDAREQDAIRAARQLRAVEEERDELARHAVQQRQQDATVAAQQLLDVREEDARQADRRLRSTENELRLVEHEALQQQQRVIAQLASIERTEAARATSSMRGESRSTQFFSARSGEHDMSPQVGARRSVTASTAQMASMSRPSQHERYGGNGSPMSQLSLVARPIVVNGVALTYYADPDRENRGVALGYGGGSVYHVPRDIPQIVAMAVFTADHVNAIIKQVHCSVDSDITQAINVIDRVLPDLIEHMRHEQIHHDAFLTMAYDNASEAEPQYINAVCRSEHVVADVALLHIVLTMTKHRRFNRETDAASIEYYATFLRNGLPSDEPQRLPLRGSSNGPAAQVITTRSPSQAPPHFAPPPVMPTAVASYARDDAMERRIASIEQHVAAQSMSTRQSPANMTFDRPIGTFPDGPTDPIVLAKFFPRGLSEWLPSVQTRDTRFMTVMQTDSKPHAAALIATLQSTDSIMTRMMADIEKEETDNANDARDNEVDAGLRSNRIQEILNVVLLTARLALGDTHARARLQLMVRSLVKAWSGEKSFDSILALLTVMTYVEGAGSDSTKTTLEMKHLLTSPSLSSPTNIISMYNVTKRNCETQKKGMPIAGLHPNVARGAVPGGGGVKEDEPRDPRHGDGDSAPRVLSVDATGTGPRPTTHTTKARHGKVDTMNGKAGSELNAEVKWTAAAATGKTAVIRGETAAQDVATSGFVTTDGRINITNAGDGTRKRVTAESTVNILTPFTVDRIPAMLKATPDDMVDDKHLSEAAISADPTVPDEVMDWARGSKLRATVTMAVRRMANAVDDFGAGLRAAGVKNDKHENVTHAIDFVIEYIEHDNRIAANEMAAIKGQVTAQRTTLANNANQAIRHVSRRGHHGKCTPEGFKQFGLGDILDIVHNYHHSVAHVLFSARFKIVKAYWDRSLMAAARTYGDAASDTLTARQRVVRYTTYMNPPPRPNTVPIGATAKLTRSSNNASIVTGTASSGTVSKAGKNGGKATVVKQPQSPATDATNTTAKREASRTVAQAAVTAKHETTTPAAKPQPTATDATNTTAKTEASRTVAQAAVVAKHETTTPAVKPQPTTTDATNTTAKTEASRTVAQAVVAAQHGTKAAVVKPQPPAQGIATIDSTTNRSATSNAAVTGNSDGNGSTTSDVGPYGNLRAEAECKQQQRPNPPLWTAGPPAGPERPLSHEEVVAKARMLEELKDMMQIPPDSTNMYELSQGVPLPFDADGATVEASTYRLVTWEPRRLTHDDLALLLYNTATGNADMKRTIRRLRRPCTTATTALELTNHFWADERIKIVKAATSKTVSKASRAAVVDAIELLLKKDGPDFVFPTTTAAWSEPSAPPASDAVFVRGQRTAHEKEMFAKMTVEQQREALAQIEMYEGMIDRNELPHSWRPQLVGMSESSEFGNRTDELSSARHAHAATTGFNPAAVSELIAAQQAYAPAAANARADADREKLHADRQQRGERSVQQQQQLGDARKVAAAQQAAALATARQQNKNKQHSEVAARAEVRDRAVAQSHTTADAAAVIAPAPLAVAAPVDNDAAVAARAFAQGNAAAAPDAGAALARLTARHKRSIAQGPVSSEISTSGNKVAGGNGDAGALLKRRAPRTVIAKPDTMPPRTLDDAIQAAVDRGGLMKVQWVDADEYNAPRCVFTTQTAWVRVSRTGDGYCGRWTHDQNGDELASVIQHRFPWPGTLVVDAQAMPDGAMEDRAATEVLQDTGEPAAANVAHIPNAGGAAPVQRHYMTVNPRTVSEAHRVAMRKRMTSDALQQYETLHPGDRFHVTFHRDGNSSDLKTHEFVMAAKNASSRDSGCIFVARAKDFDDAKLPPGHIVGGGKNTIATTNFPPAASMFITSIHNVRRRGHESYDEHAARTAGCSVDALVTKFHDDHPNSQAADFRDRRQKPLRC